MNCQAKGYEAFAALDAPNQTPLVIMKRETLADPGP
jgi:hypothetical protein